MDDDKPGGLVASQSTSGGRMSRVIALLLIIALPVVAFALNFTILFAGRTS